MLIRYLSGAVLARLADEGARVALILLALERTSTPTFGGILAAAFMLPHVIAAPLVGALADRTRHPRLLHAAGPLLFASALAAVAFGTGILPHPLVLSIAALGGIGSPLISGGLSGVIRQLIPEPQRARVYGLDVATYSVASICGPALAGTLATLVGASWSLYAIAASAASASALIGSLPLAPQALGAGALRTPASGAPHKHVQPWDGVAHIWRSRRLRAVTLATALGQVGIGGVPIVILLVAQQYGNTSLVGYLLAAIGVGALIGSLAYARFPLLTERPEVLVCLDLLFGGIPLALVAIAGPWAAAALLALVGFLSGPGAGGQFAVRDQESPPEFNTEIFAVAAGLKISMSALGAALAGEFAWLGAAPLLLGCAALQLIAAVVGVVLLQQPDWRWERAGARRARA